MSGFSSKICERCSLGREKGRSGWVCKCGKETREMVMKSDPACGSVLLRAVLRFTNEYTPDLMIEKSALVESLFPGSTSG